MLADENKIADLARQEIEKRFIVLQLVYELSRGNPAERVVMQTILQRTHLISTEHQNALKYLEDEGLIKFLDDEMVYVSITHHGRKEIEQAMNHPKQDTEHFPTQIIQHIHGDNYGAVQAGGQGNTQNVATQIQSPVNEALVRLIEALQQSRQLDEFQREDALQAAQSLQKLTEKKDVPSLLERAKQKFEQIKTIAESVKSVSEQVAPYLFTIAQHFGFAVDSVIK